MIKINHLVSNTSQLMFEIMMNKLVIDIDQRYSERATACCL